MTIQSFIALLDGNIDNIATTATKVKWINEVERYVYRNVVYDLGRLTIDTVVGQTAYELTGFLFEDIERVKVNGVEYTKMSLLNHSANTFYKANGEFTIDPAPLVAIEDAIEIVYRKVPTAKTTAGVATEKLSLVEDFGEEFENIYEYYCASQVYILRNEMDMANNFSRLYEAALSAFSIWYMKTIPNVVAVERTRNWR